MQKEKQPSSDNAQVVSTNSSDKSKRRYFLLGFVLIIFLVIITKSFSAPKIDSTPAPTPTFIVQQPTPSPTIPSIDCAKATGPFIEKGTKILQADGKVYIPYGTTVPGLAHSDYQYFVLNDNAQIQAAATKWCSNTVRLQISQDTLVGANGENFNEPFMDVIKSEVSLAESLGLVVVINAQTEDVGYEPAPTNATRMFWEKITMVYGDDSQVVFDLFNEPRMGTTNETQTWQLWQKGGMHNGNTYLGMQDLVNEVRSLGGDNLLWIEGPHTSNTLSQVSSYPITGGPLMYAIHHPEGSHTTSVWDADFGYLINNNIAPVVVGEWSNYAAVKSECWDDAPSAVPVFLSYLQHKNIGMTVWTLKKGVMTESNDLADPSHIRSDWSCKDGLDEGAGSLVMNWYKSQNEKK